MQIIKFLLEKSKATILFAISFGLLSGLSSALLITTIHRAIDTTADVQSWLPLLFGAAALAFLITSLVGQIPLFHLAEGAIFKLRVAMIKRILNSRLRYLEEVGSHRLYATLVHDIASISNGMVQVPRIVIHAVVCLGCFAYLGWLSMTVLGAMAGFIATLVVVYKLATRVATRRFRSSRETGDVLFKQFEVVTRGVKELKMHARRRQDFLARCLTPTADSYRRDRIHGLIQFQAANTVSNLGFFGVIGFIIFVLPHWHAMDSRVISGVVLIFVFLIGPLGSLLNLIPTLAEASVALKKVEALGLSLDRQTVMDSDQMPAADKDWTKLVLSGVSHTYYRESEDDRFTLGPLDLELRPGEIVYLTGGNGSGKSTLAKMLAGLYEPETGSITLNGIAVTDANRDWYRQHFSAIFSDFFLFEQFLGIDDAALERNAARYLRELNLHHKVSIKDGELSTTELSSGQRKRLALLIAYLEDRPIYLFDEWASDQDPHFKQVFYTELLPELKSRGKTVIAISHDDRYYHLGDRRIKLENGRIVTAEAQAEDIVAEIQEKDGTRT